MKDKRKITTLEECNRWIYKRFLNMPGAIDKAMIQSYKEEIIVDLKDFSLADEVELGPKSYGQ